MSLGAVKLENKLGFNKMLMCTTSYLSINLGDKLHLCHPPLDLISPLSRIQNNNTDRADILLLSANEGQLIHTVGTNRGRNRERRSWDGSNNMVLFMTQAVGVHASHCIW